MFFSKRLEQMFTVFAERGGINLLPRDQRISSKYYVYLKVFFTEKERQDVERTRQAALLGGNPKEFKEICKRIRRRLNREN